MLDNGYIYLAATRLSVHSDAHDWAIVLEVFGYSPRAGLPDIAVQTFASRPHDRNPSSTYGSRDAHGLYLAAHAHDEMRNFSPIADGAWVDDEHVAATASEIVLRGAPTVLPSPSTYASIGINLLDPPSVHVFELCRYLAETQRARVLATEPERRVSVAPGLRQILVLDEWHHPDLVSGERPSDTEAFRQLAQVAATADPTCYVPSEPANTHWSNWPDGGSL